MLLRSAEAPNARPLRRKTTPAQCAGRQGDPGRQVIVATDEEVRRLAAVIDRQRRELDRIRAAAAADSVIATARGALMERLGLSPEEAASQLAELAAATGMP